MYSVIRFSGDDTPLRELVEIISEVEPLVANATSIRRGHLSFSISTACELVVHLAQLRLYLEENKTFIDAAQRLGLSTTFDIAVEPEDLKDRYLLELCFSSRDNALFAAKGLNLAVSLYAAG